MKNYELVILTTVVVAVLIVNFIHIESLVSSKIVIRVVNLLHLKFLF